MRSSKATCLGLTLLVCGWTPQIGAENITVAFEAAAITVTGSPFDLDIPLNTAFTGSFTYDTTVADTSFPLTRGIYRHANVTPFHTTFLDHEITGSTTPTFEVLNPGTFRMIDGPRQVGLEGGVMVLDGEEDATLQLWISIVEDSANFHFDALPKPFPEEYKFGSQGTPHTFSLSNEDGTVLLQIQSMSQIPEPSRLWMIAPLFFAIAGLRRRRRAA